MLLSTIILIGILAVLIYVFLTWNYSYWQKLGVNGPKPLPLLGNYPSIFTQKRHMVYDTDDVYRKYKKDEYFVGIYSSRSPQLLITSPELVHRIYVNDFKHFHDNEMSAMVDDKSDFIFANNPFTLTGEEWKERRAELTPGLSMTKIKTVYPVTQKICKKMTDYIKRQIRMAPKDGIEAKDLSIRFTSEVVTDCVLGLNADSFGEKPTPIMGMTNKLFESSFKLILYIMTVGLFPSLKNFYKARFVPKDAEKFFLDLMENAINIRKSQAEEREDFLSYMLQLQERKKLNTMQLTAHTMTFLLDGFETSAVVISHTLLLLARNQDVLEKLRAEIDKAATGKDEIDLETLTELPYLDACIHESIRMFPPGFFSNKVCTEPIELINKNGRSLKVCKGDIVVLPLYSIMNDDDYYPSAQEYQPERFLEENGGVKKYRDMGVFTGFGDGPRICIGMRFALVQVKAAIVEVLRNFNIRTNPRTRKDNQFDPLYFLAKLDGGVWLDFEERK